VRRRRRRRRQRRRPTRPFPAKKNTHTEKHKECIARHDYQERRCVKEIAAIIECCDAVAAAGEPTPVQCSFSPSYRKLVADSGGS
jgi:hypothetical protein